MQAETRTTDAKARLVLPKAFANATVIIEQVSDTELRVRRAKVIAKDEIAFVEESATPLSDRDRDRFLSLIANPSAPTLALKRAASRPNIYRSRARRG
jgi:uncharacterized protein (DUF1778 family)